MGMMKHIMEENEEKRFIARGIAEEAGAIKECEYHPGTFIDQYDSQALETAYKIANKRFTGKTDDSVSLFKTRRELTDTIKEVVEETGDYCYSCKKWEKD